MSGLAPPGGRQKTPSFLRGLAQARRWRGTDRTCTNNGAPSPPTPHPKIRLRDTHDDHHHYRLRALTRRRQGTGARYARSLGARGSGPALRGSPRFVSGDEGARASGASSFRPDSDLRGRRSRSVRDRLDRVPYRPAPCRPAAGRCRCAGARDHLDVRRAQHGGAADPRTRNRQDPRGRQAVEQGAPAPGRGSRPRPVEAAFRPPRQRRLARWRVQRRRPDDGVGAAAAEIIGHPGRIIRTWRPISPAAKRGPPTSGLSPLNWRFSPASHRPAD